MTRISQLALAACLISAGHAFTVTHHQSSSLSSSSTQQQRSLLLTQQTRPRPISPTTLLFSTEASSSSETTSTLKKLPQSSVELTLQIPPAQTQSTYSKVLSTVSTKLSIPGFRKNAPIPPAVIENAWNVNGGKRDLRKLAINELASSLIQDTLKKSYELDPIGQPSILPSVEECVERFVPGEQFTLVVRCDVWPDIDWKTTTADDDDNDKKPYLGLTGKYKRKPFNQERFDAALRDLTERYAKLEPFQDTDAPLSAGDACVVNMSGYLDNGKGERGEALPEGVASGENVEVVLGAGRYMEGLVEGLIGGKVGETKEVRVRFPDALKNKDLAGKDAIFDVTIVSASKRILPEITDEFASQVRPGLTTESLREELRKAVDSQDAQEYMGARNEALGAALAEVLEVEVPDTLVTNQAKEKYALMMTDMRNSGMGDDEIKNMINPENFIKYKDIYAEGIVRDFKISMALDEISRLENIQVPAYQIEEQLQQLKDQAKQAGQADEFDDEQVRKKVESTLERRMVFDFLAEHANLEVEYMEEGEEQFDEALMEKLAQESLDREQSSSEGEPESENAEVVAAASAADVEEAVAEEVPAVELKVETEEEKMEAKAEELEPVVTEKVEEKSAPELIRAVKLDKSKYEGMDPEEKAFNMLVDSGMVEVHPDPDAPGFDIKAYEEELKKRNGK